VCGLLIKEYHLSSSDDIIYVTNRMNSTLLNEESNSCKVSVYDSKAGDALDLVMF
jgi:hypothetical protein